MNQNSLIQILDAYHENRLSHAFLIETDNQEKSLLDLKKVIQAILCEKDYQENCSLCNLCHLIDIENLPSFIVIRPDGMNIRKEQILDLKQKFSTKPIYSKYNIYIVMNAEKFNSSSANTILKFLEEPEEGIKGFFLTNNKENIIDTIKSRCQIISNYYHNEVVNDEDILDFTKKFLFDIHTSKEMAILKNKERIEYISSKDAWQHVFQCMIDIYFYFYHSSVSNKLDNQRYKELQFLCNKSSDYLFHQLKLVESLEEELNYNVNLNLLLDRLVLEMES